jgi:hypothetical protein
VKWIYQNQSSIPLFTDAEFLPDSGLRLYFVHSFVPDLSARLDI